MYDTDFQLYWGNAARMSGPCPWIPIVKTSCPGSTTWSLESPGKGLLVYEVPQEETEFTLAFLELIENGTEGGRGREICS